MCGTAPFHTYALSLYSLVPLDVVSSGILTTLYRGNLLYLVNIDRSNFVLLPGCYFAPWLTSGGVGFRRREMRLSEYRQKIIGFTSMT